MNCASTRMRLLSIDVGIRNLAMCVLEVEGTNYQPTIHTWTVVDLAPLPLCQHCTQRTASLFQRDLFVCRQCGNNRSPELVIVTPKIRQACTAAFAEACLRKAGCLHAGQRCTKAAVRDFLRERALLPYKHPPASSIPLPQLAGTLASALRDLLSRVGGPIDCVAIENQVGPQAIRMKSVQAMVTQHLVTTGTCAPSEITYVSAQAKLRAFPAHKGLDYRQRKELATKACEHMLVGTGGEDSNWLQMLNAHPKKDDLADAYLQGVAVLVDAGYAPPRGWGSSDVRIT